MRNTTLNSPRCLLVLTALLCCVAANAVPLAWQVQATFDDGGTAFGTFVFDAATNTFSAVDITTTTGSTRTGAHYTRANLVAAGSSFVLLLTNAAGNLTGTPSFAAQLVSPMTDAGGLINFNLTAAFHQEESCADAGCTGGTTPRRFMTAGAVSTATTSDSPFQVRFVANLAAAGDSVINISNTGAAGTAGGANICVNVYAFSPDEQLISCCACTVTPNGLVSLSAKTDLISNTLTPAVPGSIVVKLLATTGGACNAASVNAQLLTTGLVAWGTTVHAAPGGAFAVVETPFTPATLSAAELARITAVCGFIQSNGSGYGICRSCRAGALGGAKK